VAYAYTLAPSLTVIGGEFREDIQEILDLLSRDPGVPALWHDLDHMAGLLRGIG
jgi:hypothetical protein